MADLSTIFIGVVSFLIILVLSVVIWWRFYIKRWSHLKIPKGCLPVLGHIHLMKSKSTDAMIEWFHDFTKENGPTFVFFFFWKPVIFSRDIKVCKTLLSSQKYITKTKQVEMLRDWLGTGLLTGTGQLWKERRRLFTPAFHLDILSNNIPVLEKQANILVKYIKECQMENDITKFVPLSNLFAMSAICEFAMGVPMILLCENPEPSAKKFSQSTKELALTINSRFMNPLYKSDKIFGLTKQGKKYFSNLEFYRSFVKSVIEERINIHKESHDSKPKIFLDILLDAYQKNQIDVDGIMGEVNSFMFAGNETTSTALSWVVFYIAKYTDVQEKLYKEFKSYKERNLSMNEILKESVYLDCVIKEIARLTAGPALARCIENDSQINELFIPAGTEIMITALNIHYDEQNWPNPREFRPERFREEDAEEYNFKFLPFSAGPRNCIGKRFAMVELKIAVFYLVTNFKIKIEKEIENPYRFKAFVDPETEFQFLSR